MLYAELSAGLGNRLQALASAVHLAKICNEPITVVWDIGNGFGSKFRDLFDLPEDIPVYNITRGGFRSNPFLYLYSMRTVKKLHKETTLFLRSGGIYGINKEENGYQILQDLVKIEKNTHIDSYIGYFPEKELKPEYFSFIKPSQKILDFANPTISLLTDNTYGIHIRRTDHIDAIEHSPTVLFENTIREILAKDSDARFYVASDDTNVVNQLKKAFGNTHIISQASPVLSRNSKVGAFCAFTDMLCLSKCQKIYGSFGSTFSQLASLLGNTTLTVLKTE